jgi:hypothetical protein
VDDVKVRGWYTGTVLYRTYVNEKNVVEHWQARAAQPARCRQHMGNASGSVDPAVTRPDTVVPRVEEYKGEDDGKDPIHSRQGEHGGDDAEEPFP